MSAITKNVFIEVFLLLGIAFLPIWLQCILYFANAEAFQNLPSIKEFYWAVVLSTFTFFSTTFIKFYPQRSVKDVGLLVISGVGVFILALVCSTFFVESPKITFVSAILYSVIFVLVFGISIRVSYLEWTSKDSVVLDSNTKSSEKLGDKLAVLRSETKQ